MVLTGEEVEEISKFFTDNAATGISISPVTDASGFQGCYYSLHVGRTDSKLFIKSVPGGDDVVDDFYRRTGIFVKEVAVYRNLLPKMADFGKLWPDCCLAREGRYLVLEDMAVSGWRTASTMDEIHVAVALRGFAKFHASSLSVLDEAENSVIFSSIAVETMLSTDPESPGRQMWNAFCKFAQETYSAHFPESDVDVFGVFQNAIDVVNRESGFRTCLNHGDPWMNNLLFNYSNNIPTMASFVDFQSARLAPPALDVSIFLNIFQPDRVEFLATSIYYDELSKNLLDREIEVLSRQEFIESIKYFEKTAKCVASLYIFLTKLPFEYMSKILVDQKTFIKFALGQNYSVAWEALKSDAEYRNVFLKYLRSAIN